MQPLHDYILVKEVIPDTSIKGTSLKIKYDDSERFMFVEVIKPSRDLAAELAKYYPVMSRQDITFKVRDFKEGNVLIINRVAKTPYKDGMYFISFKDVIAIESTSDLKLDDPDDNYDSIGITD